MSNYCQEPDKKATITLSKNGKAFVVECSNPPITINCKNNEYNDCTPVTVKFQFNVFVNNSNTIYKPSIDNVMAPVKGIKLDRNGIDILVYSKGTFGTCAAFAWRFIYRFNSSGQLSNPIITDIIPASTNVQGGTKGVIIQDKDGSIVFSDNSIDCSWTVQCGECPPGTDKQTIAAYPGYCCMDCASIEAQIKAITSQIRI